MLLAKELCQLWVLLNAAASATYRAGQVCGKLHYTYKPYAIAKADEWADQLVVLASERMV